MEKCNSVASTNPVRCLTRASYYRHLQLGCARVYSEEFGLTVNHELEATANVFEEDGFYLVVVTISFTFSSIPNMLTLNTPFKRA